MPKPRDQEFECLGIPLKQNVFATLQQRALSAPCTKEIHKDQGIVSIWSSCSTWIPVTGEKNYKMNMRLPNVTC
jgi:hypothetical protein